jgi:prophage regulatory protein
MLMIVIPETGFLRLPQVLALFPVSKSTFWAGIRDGKYPKPVKLSTRCSAWRAEDIKALIANYAAK